MRMKLAENAIVGKTVTPKKNQIFWITVEDKKEKYLTFATIYEDISFFKFLFRKTIKKFKGV